VGQGRVKEAEDREGGSMGEDRGMEGGGVREGMGVRWRNEIAGGCHQLANKAPPIYLSLRNP
jgi:hypothetical protein